MRAFSTWNEWGLLSSCGPRASHCTTRDLEHVGLVVVAHGLSCPVAYGIFLDQGLNLCPLRWLVDSQTSNTRKVLWFSFCSLFCHLSRWLYFWVLVSLICKMERRKISLHFPGLLWRLNRTNANGNNPLEKGVVVSLVSKGACQLAFSD